MVREKKLKWMIKERWEWAPAHVVPCPTLEAHSILILFYHSFEFFTIRMKFAVGSLYMAFIMLRYFSSIAIILSVIIINGYLSCQMLFLNLVIWSYDFYPLFVNMVCHIDHFVYVESSLCLWNEPHLIVYIIFLMYCTWFDHNLFRIFVSIFSSNIVL